MSNLTELAFPIDMNPDPNFNFNPGFTKHELAAIMMAQTLAGKTDGFPNSEERKQIAGAAYDLAEAVLSYFNNPK
jgi:hypothetical protein